MGRGVGRHPALCVCCRDNVVWDGVLVVILLSACCRDNVVWDGVLVVILLCVCAVGTMLCGTGCWSSSCSVCVL